MTRDRHLQVETVNSVYTKKGRTKQNRGSNTEEQEQTGISDEIRFTNSTNRNDQKRYRGIQSMYSSITERSIGVTLVIRHPYVVYSDE